MATHPANTSFSSFSLNTKSDVPLYRQLYEELRGAVLSGRLKPGMQLPSSRLLATELAVSRNTVINAFEQLHAEGYIEGQAGAGTFVSRVLPEELLQVRHQSHRVWEKSADAQLSHRGILIAATAVSFGQKQVGSFNFDPCLPSLDGFPFNLWSRLSTRRWHSRPDQLLDYGDPAGYAPLREAIAAYLGLSRGVRCEPEQVIITSGAQQGINLASSVLLDPGDSVWVEDPGYIAARAALRAAGADIVPVPVDEEGLDVAAGIAKARNAKAAYVTPSHQFPLGVIMSLGRRLALLEWAQKSDAWIFEDDYDSEYRFWGRPQAALHGLDLAGRVIYVGTFSKVLWPSLRLGYLVVPRGAVDAFVSARALFDRFSPLHEQGVLTDFITEGHFARHIRRMRLLYAERQNILLKALSQDLGEMVTTHPSNAGLHLVAWLPKHFNDQAATRSAAVRGVNIQPLSWFSLKQKLLPGMLLGYGGMQPKQLHLGVRRLALALRELT